MILEYRCSNFKAIKEEVVFSMMASSDTSNSDYLLDFNDKKVNQVSSIYGANGSGKTSLLESMNFFKGLILNGINQQPGDYIPINTHKLSKEDEPSEFILQFVKNGIRYMYGISVTKEKVVKEYLYHFPKKRPAKIFDREYEEYTFGKNFMSELKEALFKAKENRPFLSVAANNTNIKEIENVFLFFKEDIVVYLPEAINNWQEYSFNKINSDKNLKRKVINAFRSLGVNINDIKTERHRISFPEEMLEDLPVELRPILSDRAAEVNAVFLDYGDFMVSIDDESSGVKKLFEVLCPIIDIIENDKILLWDEIENGLHDIILHKLLQIFIKNKDSNAQLIFTTHDINLLDLNILRRDQIWFAELEISNRQTELYSLSEFKDIRKTENVSKNYINGRYGAIPFLKTNIQFKGGEE